MNNPSAAQRSGAAQSWSASVTNANYQIYADPEMIRRDPGSLGPEVAEHYGKFVVWTAPNGKDITLVASDAISDEQLLRAWNILDFYLTDVPGSKYGADKTAVANMMAENGAVLVMPDGADGESSTPESALLGQPLYQLEFPVEGSTAYITNDYDQRDAGFEEIFHMVHDTGIGSQFTTGALKTTYQADITKAMNNALANSLWGIGDEDTQNWLDELREEGSLEQEYIVSAMDSYYGLWGAWDEGPGGMWGAYSSKTRAEVLVNDPMGAQLIRDFLPDNLTYMARIDPGFSGVFQMGFDANEAYTHKSQYLINARLLGDKDSGLSGNGWNNFLIGNAGANSIDGKGGTDVVQYRGMSTDYIIRTVDGVTTVTSGSNPGDVDTLENIEILRFTDTDVQLDGGHGAASVEGTGGDDTLQVTSTPETILLEDGADSLEGALEDFFRDTVHDFGHDDQFVFLDAQVARGDMSVARDSATVISIDADKDGAFDGWITMEGDFSGGDFMAVQIADDTKVTFESYLPTLAEGRAVASAEINGIANQDFLTGNGSRTFNVQLQDLGFAGYNNSVGVYEVTPDGRIVDARLLFNNANSDKSAGATVDAVEAGNSLGFFLVQNAADWANGLAASDEISFVNMTGADATVADAAAVRLAVNGSIADQMVFHSYARALNSDGVQHALSGVREGGEAITIGFEDLTGGGDRDYEDVVLTISVNDLMIA